MILKLSLKINASPLTSLIYLVLFPFIYFKNQKIFQVRMITQYSFSSDTISNLRYKSEKYGELQVSRNFFDRIPITN